MDVIPCYLHLSAHSQKNVTFKCCYKITICEKCCARYWNLLLIKTKTAQKKLFNIRVKIGVRVFTIFNNQYSHLILDPTKK